MAMAMSRTAPKGNYAEEGWVDGNADSVRLMLEVLYGCWGQCGDGYSGNSENTAMPLE